MASPVLVLAVLVWRVGTGAFVGGVREVNAGTLAAATGIALLTTLCSSWRWRIVARGLGVTLSLPAAVAAYYRSVFLNVTLPGGVLGDVHRGVSHGRDVGDVSRALRAVVWERSAGQVVQGAFTVAVLLALPSPVRSTMPVVAATVVVAVIAAVLAVRARPGHGRSAWARVRSTIAGDLRSGVLARRAWPAIALTSALVVIGHAITFLVAARTAGTTAPLTVLLPIALLAMTGMVLPSAAGWGPREGVTAWAFAAAGLGAQRGVATAVVYGVMVLFASLPGAAVLAVEWWRRTRSPTRTAAARREEAVHA